MGAYSVTGTIKGETIAAAYRRAKDQAGWESGHGYSGTIAESQGYIALPALFRPEAEARAERALRDGTVEKWGPCAIIPIKPTGSHRTATVEVDILGLDHEGVAAKVLAAAKALAEDGEVVEAVRTNTPDSYTFDEPRGVTEKEAVISTPTGPTGTRFILTNDGGNGRLNVIGTTATLAEAEELASREARRVAGRVSISSYSERPERVVEVRTTKRTAVVIATLGTPTGGKPTEFITAGIYSS
jgi:hypothetical protein